MKSLPLIKVPFPVFAEIECALQEKVVYAQVQSASDPKKYFSVLIVSGTFALVGWSREMSDFAVPPLTIEIQEKP